MITTDELTKAYGGHHRRPRLLPGTTRPRHGLPRSQRCRQVDDDAHGGRPDPPTSGTATIDGRRFVDLPNPGREVGVLLDASAQHAGRTGREILTIAARTMGLPRTGSTDAGPRQPHRRRGGASGPQLLPRDAPAARHRHRTDRRAAGAHPRRTRQRARPGRHPLDAGPASRLRRRGGTVLLSSHLLHEIEIIADDLVVIGNGRIVAQGTKTELLQAAGTVVRTPDLPALEAALRTRRSSRPRAPATAPCGPTLTWPWSARCARRPAWPSPSCEPQTVPAWKRCSSSSPLQPNEKEQQHDCHHSRPCAARTSSRRPSSVVPLTAVELRKMFDTRSGFWLMASIVISALIATIALIVFAPDDELTYASFGKAIAYPMLVILPMIALLSVTSEWSQRSGLTTFTLIPHRGRVITAKASPRSPSASPQWCSPWPSALSATWWAPPSPGPQYGTSRSPRAPTSCSGTCLAS